MKQGEPKKGHRPAMSSKRAQPDAVPSRVGTLADWAIPASADLRLQLRDLTSDSTRLGLPLKRSSFASSYGILGHFFR